MTRFTLRALLLLGTLALVLAACVQGGGPNPNPTPTSDLSIGAPQDGQTLAGTVIVLAGGVGGSAQDLAFTLGDLQVDADSDGTAILDTRDLDDGEYDLTANATVDGQQVEDTITVTVTNDLPDSGQVGPDGGTLKSGEGSYATLPPGALDDDATLTLTDTTQQQILDEFGVDYSALGVTFLGSLTVDATNTTTTRTNTPVQVDLAGWAQAVQPQQDVVMFNVLSDADGDGVGELTFAANARATPDGSVVTLPTPTAEVYGFAAGDGSLRLQQATAVRPGEIVTLQGRGLTPYSPLGNTARLTSGTEILVAVEDLEGGAFNPLQEIALAVPALGQGSRQLTLVNATTGYESESFTLQIGSAGSGDQATWDAFLEQLDVAIERITAGRDALKVLAESFRSGIQNDATLRAMAANSGLVTSANLALLQEIDASGYGTEQRNLVVRHALLLDAMAVSVASTASAADLASLLVTASPVPDASATASLRGQQTGGSCTGASAPVFWGQPTGMGSAPPGGCAGGGSAGGGGGGGSPLKGQRLGSYGPVANAIVTALMPDGSGALSPFTAITDEAGHFLLPFLPPGEPFLIRAIDPVTGDIAESSGITPDVGSLLPISLAFAPSDGGSSDAIELTVEAVDDAFPGGGHYALDAVTTLPPGVEVSDYVWVLDDDVVTINFTSHLELTLLREGSYDVRVTVTDTDGLFHVAEATIVVEPFPHPYVADPPQRVNTAADGSEAVGEPGNSGFPAYVSSDGRWVLFGSEAANLVPNDTNSLADVFLKDVQTGAIERISQALDGTETDGTSGSRGFHLAGDGSHAAFYSEATNLDAGCVSAGCSYVLDRDAGTLTAVQGPINSRLWESPILSPNERYLAIIEGSITACQGGICQITVEDLMLGGQVLASTAANGTVGNAPAFPWGFTADGRKLLFTSRADNLVPDDTNATDDVFLKDLDTGAIERISVAQDGTESDGRSWSASISADGRYVAFATEADNLIPGGNSAPGETQILRKDLTTGEIELVSRNPLGLAANSSSYSASISADGRYVAFGGYATDLVPGTGFDLICGCDSNGYNPGYSYVADMDTGRVALLTYDGDGWLDAEGDFQIAYDSTEPTISADGRWIVVTSEANELVPNDTNGERDVFLYQNPLWEAAP